MAKAQMEPSAPARREGKVLPPRKDREVRPRALDLLQNSYGVGVNCNYLLSKLLRGGLNCASAPCSQKEHKKRV